MSEVALYQFAMSHFNEKARWGLDWKRIPHRRHSLLPGPHKLQMMRLSGQDQVPVLKHGEDVIAGSAQILAHLEAFQPAAPLLPEDPALADEARRLQSEFDATLGPAVRLARFVEVMPNPGYFARQFTHDKSRATQLMYGAMFPLVKGLMTKQMNLSAENAVSARATMAETLDRLARDAAASDYLVGDRFSIADLTAAALLMPAVEPPGGPAVALPRSTEAETWLARWADHPGAEWVREIYRRHRGESAEVAA
jgi:glutathione S-transferase